MYIIFLFNALGTVSPAFHAFCTLADHLYWIIPHALHTLIIRDLAQASLLKVSQFFVIRVLKSS